MANRAATRLRATVHFAEQLMARYGLECDAATVVDIERDLRGGDAELIRTSEGPTGSRQATWQVTHHDSGRTLQVVVDHDACRVVTALEPGSYAMADGEWVQAYRGAMAQARGTAWVAWTSAPAGHRRHAA